MKTTIFWIGLLFNLTWVSFVYAQDNTCWIEAPSQDDVWAIIYDADADGNRNNIIWKGKIAAGQKVKINSTDGHIRYDYKLDPDQPYEGDVSEGCFGQRSISID